MKLIVGLGNPGPRYQNTRHNAGFRVVDLVATRMHIRFDRVKYRGVVAETVWENEPVMLLKPSTFMNESGQSVGPAVRDKTADLSDLLVIVDDVNLPLGKLRIRPGGSAGGHKGLQSIIEHVGADAFPRLRLGVGNGEQGDSLTAHVLGSFLPEEISVIDHAVKQAADAVGVFVTLGLEQMMNQYN